MKQELPIGNTHLQKERGRGGSVLDPSLWKSKKAWERSSIIFFSTLHCVPERGTKEVVQMCKLARAWRMESGPQANVKKGGSSSHEKVSMSIYTTKC